MRKCLQCNGFNPEGNPLNHPVFSFQTNLDTSLKGISLQIEPLEKSYNEVEGDLMEISNSYEEIKNFMTNFNTTFSNQQNDNTFKNISDETLKKVEKNMVNQFNSFALKVCSFVCLF